MDTDQMAAYSHVKAFVEHYAKQNSFVYVSGVSLQMQDYSAYTGGILGVTFHIHTPQPLRNGSEVLYFDTKVDVLHILQALHKVSQENTHLKYELPSEDLVRYLGRAKLTQDFMQLQGST